MYQPPQQKKSSWTPSTAQSKSKSSSKLGRFSIQPKSQQIHLSPPLQEIGEYSRKSADRLAANAMRGFQAKEQEQAETSTVQRKSESPWAPTFDAPPPITQNPASQLKGAFAPVSENQIQRQCAECAKEEQEQKGEEGKEVDEISAASSNIQTKLTTGESGEIKEPAANPMPEVMSKPIFSDHTPQVQGFRPQENPMDIWARAQAIGPIMARRVDHQAEMAAIVQRAFEMGRKEAAVKPVQAKLTLGQPGDKYEQEADAVARTVVEQINTPTTGESVQRESESHPFTSPPNPPISVSSVMRQSPGSVGEGASVSQDVEQGIQQAKGGGKGLDESVREPMEQAFGADFSGVKVHADGNADQLNRSISARAFTTGQDIFFKQGEYSPGSRGGQELLAHELTHVVQQTSEVRLQPQKAEDQAAKVAKMSADFDTYVQEGQKGQKGGWKQAALVLNGFAMFDILPRVAKINSGHLDKLKNAADQTMKGWPPRVQFAVEVVKNRNLPEGMQGLVPHDDPVYADKWLKQSGQPMGKSRVPVGTNGMFEDNTPTPALKRWDYVVYQDHVRLGNRKVDNTPGGPVIGSWPWMTNNPGDLTGDLNPRKENRNDPASYYWQDQRIWGKPRRRGQSLDTLKPIEDSSQALSSGNTAVEGFAARKDLAIFADRERGRRALKEWIKENYGKLTLAKSVKKHLGPQSSHVSGVDDPEKYPKLLQQYLSDKNYKPNYVASTHGEDVKDEEWNDVIDAFGFAEGFYNRRPDPDAKGKFQYHENKGIIYRCDKRDPIDVDPAYQKLKRVTDMPETTPPEIKKLLGCD